VELLQKNVSPNEQVVAEIKKRKNTKKMYGQTNDNKKLCNNIIAFFLLAVSIRRTESVVSIVISSRRRCFFLPAPSR